MRDADAKPLAEILTNCDQKFAGAIQDAIDAKQAEYAAGHKGRFWQGLPTHDVIPREGKEEAATVGTKTPTDQAAEPWPDVVMTSSLPMTVQVDVYDGPYGTGYTTTLVVEVEGRAWALTTNIGPETWRAQEWAEAPALPALT